MTGGARDRRACPRTRRKTHFNAFAVSCFMHGFMSHETRATPDAYVCRMLRSSSEVRGAAVSVSREQRGGLVWGWDWGFPTERALPRRAPFALCILEPR